MPGAWQKRTADMPCLKKKFAAQLLIWFLIEFFSVDFEHASKTIIKCNTVLRNEPKSILAQQNDTSVPTKF